jgi:uridine phosphorylase
MAEKKIIAESELIINPDGSAYHLHLLPEEVAETIITVGDPGRVQEVSKHFDSIQVKKGYREFVTHTGYLNNKRLTVISTGIGTDNIDIVMNEIDALVNIDFKTRTVKDELTSLDVFRLGTSGSVSEEIDVDSVVMSEIAIGMDGLLNFYQLQNSIQETVYLEAFNSHIRSSFDNATPYIASASEKLLKKFEDKFIKGTTVTACGFYAPQGRKLRLTQDFPDFVPAINKFRHKHFRITNLEMETAAIYGMGKLLGHNCLSINAILANRVLQKFSANPKKIVDKMILEALEIITL